MKILRLLNVSLLLLSATSYASDYGKKQSMFSTSYWFNSNKTPQAETSFDLLDQDEQWEIIEPILQKPTHAHVSMHAILVDDAQEQSDKLQIPTQTSPKLHKASSLDSVSIIVSESVNQENQATTSKANPIFREGNISQKKPPLRVKPSFRKNPIGIVKKLSSDDMSIESDDEETSQDSMKSILKFRRLNKETNESIMRIQPAAPTPSENTSKEPAQKPIQSFNPITSLIALIFDSCFKDPGDDQ